MTPDDLKALVDRRLTLAQMGKELGVSKWTVRRRLIDAGLSAPCRPGGAPGQGRPASLTPAEVRALVGRAEAQGWTQKEAADSAGIHVRTLKGLRKRYGVEWWR